MPGVLGDEHARDNFGTSLGLVIWRRHRLVMIAGYYKYIGIMIEDC